MIAFENASLVRPLPRWNRLKRIRSGENDDESRLWNIRTIPPSAAQRLKQGGGVGIAIGLRLHEVDDGLLIRLFRA